jgi:hypothetical protein
MRIHWIPAALMSSALVVGCNKPAEQSASATATAERNINQNPGAPQAIAPPATDQSGAGGINQAPSTGDRSLAPTTEGARATTGIVDSGTTSQSHHASIDRPSAPPDVPIRDNRAANLTNRASARTARSAREVTVPAGTSLPLELATPLSSETAHVETPVRARLRSPVRVSGYTAMPAGTVFNGSVTHVEESGRVKGRAMLALHFTEATVNGVRERVRTNPVTFQAEATKGEDATKIGAGAGIGAAIGAIVGGGKGAAKGAAIGGAAGTGAVLATKGKEVNLAAGTDITTTLAQSVTVRAR